MSRTRTFEGEGSSADTRVNLLTQGSVSSPNSKTPSGAKKIDKVIAAVGADTVAAGRCAFLVRIGGDAVKDGEQTIIVSGAATTVAESGASDPGAHGDPFVLEDADIDVDPSEDIVVDVEMLDDDIGTVAGVVTLIFD